MRLLTLGLLLLLVLVQLELWFSGSSIPHVLKLQSQVDEQKAANERARMGNEQLGAEVIDLREGLEMVEEKARGELGMVKPDEIFIQVSPPRP